MHFELTFSVYIKKTVSVAKYEKKKWKKINDTGGLKFKQRYFFIKRSVFVISFVHLKHIQYNVYWL